MPTAFVVAVARALTAHARLWSPRPPYAPAFRGFTSGLGAILNAHDGQAFGSLAIDPLLSHPQQWGGGAAEMAYRACRPLLGWLAIPTSLGSARAAAWSLLGWSVVAVGLLAAAASLLARAWGRQTAWVPMVILLPAVLGQLLFVGLSDTLAAALVLFGLALWIEQRERPAVVLFCLAALCRETTLLVPAALWLASPPPRTRRLILPVLVYVSWVAVVWLRLGQLPNAAPEGHLGLPFVGLAQALRHGNWVQVVSLASLVVAGAVAWTRAPTRAIRVLVLLSAVLAALLPLAVWRSWDFTRALLPVTVVGCCLLAPTTTELPQAPGTSGRSRRGDVVTAS